MILTLEVTGPQAGRTEGASRHEFGPEGGTIGRDTSSTWVLPHTKVSGLHAVITYRSSVFYIEDRSRNGVCLNSATNRLLRGQPYPLKAGDSVLIDPYVIRVSVATASHSSPFDADPFDPQRSPRPLSPLSSESSEPESPFDASSSAEVDPMKLLGLPRPAPARKAPSAGDLARSSPMEAHYRPPPVVPAPPSPSWDPTAIPQDYNPLEPDDTPFEPAVTPLKPAVTPFKPVVTPFEPAVTPFEPAVTPFEPAVTPFEPAVTPFEPAVTPFEPDFAAPGPYELPPVAPPSPPVLPKPVAPVPRLQQDAEPPVFPPLEQLPPREIAVVAAPPRQDPAPISVLEPTSEGSDLAAMLAGAGLGPVAVTPELARSFGEILRVVVSGVMDVMRARQQIKDEFRMRMTQFRPVDNNPLKFSANVDDALHNLLVKRNAAFLGPVEAFEDAFDDLRNHQMAMLAGMRQAFESMLAQFDPDHLQEQFDRQLKKGSLLGVPSRLRYWEMYRDACSAMVKDPEASFRKLFGEEFAKAYEEQLKRLKAEGASRTAPSKTPGQPEKK